MANVFWESTDDAYTEADQKHGRGPNGAVSEQHPLPVQIAWRAEGDDEHALVDEANGLPVQVSGIALTSTKLFAIKQPIPGIGAAVAYTAGDAFGTKFAIQVPVEGTIATVVFHDLDAEGLQKEIVLFSEEFTGTADNAAFAPTDLDIVNCVGVISIATFYSFNANQVGISTPALYYVAPKGLLYAQLVTRGADNIAAGSIPMFSMVIT